MRSRTVAPPGGLARRFAVASAGLAAGALLLVSVASWWLIARQHDVAVAELVSRERQFHASAVASDLSAVHVRMSEMAASTILATGLVDSAGRETYLLPFLGSVRQINGVPIQVLFTDFEGKEIASNTGAAFSAAQMGWLRERIEAGRQDAAIFGNGPGAELVAVQPLVYSRTTSPEGALFYKLRLADLHTGGENPLEWGAAAPMAGTTKVKVPPPLEPLGLRVRTTPADAAATSITLQPQVLPIIVISLVLFSLVVLAGSRIAAVLTRELRELEGFSKRVVGQGLTAERATEAGSEEVHSLAASLNQMLDMLRARQEALTAANRRKDEFLAMLAHELRNPLAPITTGAQLLRANSKGNETVARTSAVILRQAQHMAKLVDDLLDVSRVTRGLITLARRPLDLRDVLSEAEEQSSAAMQARGHRLDVSIGDEPVWVDGDPARLVQVVTNLLNNSARYTPPGGYVELILATRPEAAELTVRDNGMGIPPELMPEIFDLFTQGSRSSDRSQGGLGLGLALVKTLVELHGGAVSAQSEGANRGSTFVVTLPRCAAPVDSKPVPSPAPSVPVAGARVLVVDDNVDAAQTLAALLEMEGHDVRVAHDAASALRLAREYAADAFFLDIGLPDMSGTELARALRQIPQARGALLVALTGYGQPGDRVATRDAGFDRHLVKPVQPEELLSLLRVPVRAP